MAYAKSLREKLPALAAAMQAIIDGAKNDNERGLNSEERTRFNLLVDEHTAIEEGIKAQEKVTSITDQLAAASAANGRVVPSAEQVEQMQDEFRIGKNAKRNTSPADNAYSKYLRHGIGALNADERKFMQLDTSIRNTMSTTTGSQGGYTVPTGFSGMLEEAKKWFGGIDGVVEKFSTETGNPLPWPTLNDTANRGSIIGQNQQVVETDLAFGQVTFNAYIGSSNLVLIPLALMQDSFFDLDTLVARLLGTRLGRLFNWKGTVGTGTNEPTGIVTAAVAAGSIETFPTGETVAITYNDLVNVEHRVDPDYRFNAATRWMFSDAQLKLIKKLVDGQGRPLWQPGLSASFRDGAAVDLIAAKPTILDHPYVINQDMAVPAANAYSLLFGDMSTFKAREVAGGTTVLRLTERYADYLQVGFIAFQRFDTNLIDAGTHPVAVGQNSAT